VSTIVSDSPHKLFVGCIPNYLNEDQVIVVFCSNFSCMDNLPMLECDIKLVHTSEIVLIHSIYEWSHYWGIHWSEHFMDWGGHTECGSFVASFLSHTSLSVVCPAFVWSYFLTALCRVCGRKLVVYCLDLHRQQCWSTDTNVVAWLLVHDHPATLLRECVVKGRFKYKLVCRQSAVFVAIQEDWS